MQGNNGVYGSREEPRKKSQRNVYLPLFFSLLDHIHLLVLRVNNAGIRLQPHSLTGLVVHTYIYE